MYLLVTFVPFLLPSPFALSAKVRAHHSPTSPTDSLLFDRRGLQAWRHRPKSKEESKQKYPKLEQISYKRERKRENGRYFLVYYDAVIACRRPLLSPFFLSLSFRLRGKVKKVWGRRVTKWRISNPTKQKICFIPIFRSWSHYWTELVKLFISWT